MTSTSLPSGVVTFAFTDIEGSTTRWERDRMAMQDAVRRHDAILRAAIEEHDGHVFKTIGDAFCAAFARPEDALAAMLDAQRALAAEDFSAVDGLRVRVALHTGTADEREGDYVGPALNKVTRLLAVGHGGQMLLSAETAVLAGSVPAADTSLLDLGSYHWKDFAEPQRVYQIIASGLPADFPPLRAVGMLSSDQSIIDAQEFHPVATFGGREDELAELEAALAKESAKVVVHGLGGVGKSSIAREYGWRNRERYSVVWWLNAQTEDGIIEGLLRLGARFVHGLDQMKDRRAAAQRALHALLEGLKLPVLLVFDNLEDERLMRTWLPGTGIRALGTSRDATWSTDVVSIPLQAWSLDVAVAYLQRASARPDLSEADAREIVQALGGLPLAVAHASAAMRNLRMVSVQRYLERVSEHLRKAPRGAEYPRSVFATFTTAIAHAEEQAAGAAAVLCFAASFGPDAIPDELFRQAVDRYADGLRPTLSHETVLDLRSAVADELWLDEALGALDRLSLLAFSQRSRTYSMHRLVQLAAQDLMGEDTSAWRACAVDVADAAFPDQKDVAMWPQCERFLPHARAALDAMPSDTALAPVGRLAYRCADYLRQRGQFASAEHLATHGLAIQERALGPDHPEVVQSLSNLGIVYWNQGRYAEAESLHTRALAIREKALMADDPDIAFGLNNLAGVYHDQGRHAEAEQLHWRALAIWEKALGPDHPRITFSLNNLAVVYFDQGRYEEAEPLFERALAIREAALGPDHPEVALSLNNLSELKWQRGRHDEAERLCLRSIAIRENVLGPDHPDVAVSLGNLGRMHASQGRHADAESLHRRALAIREKAFGPQHFDAARCLNDLADSYLMQRRHTEAKSLLERALTIRENALGPDHPSTQSTREALDALRSESMPTKA